MVLRLERHISILKSHDSSIRLVRFVFSPQDFSRARIFSGNLYLTEGLNSSVQLTLQSPISKSKFSFLLPYTSSSSSEEKLKYFGY